MRKPVVIRTPFPTTEEIAEKMGVSPERTKEIQAMVAAIVKRQREQEAAAGRAAKNGRSAKRRRQAAKARVS